MIDIVLYTRLVTYARLYILTLVVPCYHVISYISFIVCYWYWLFCYLLFWDYHVIAYIVFLYTRTFPVTRTLIRSLLTTLDSHVQGIGHLLILFRYSCDRTRYEKLESLFFIIGILAILFMLFLILSLSYPVAIFFPIFICYHCVRYLYVILQWYWFIVVDFVTWSGYFRLSVCAWVFFSRTYVADLRRNSVSVYFGKRGVTYHVLKAK